MARLDLRRPSHSPCAHTFAPCLRMLDLGDGKRQVLRCSSANEKSVRRGPRPTIENLPPLNLGVRFHVGLMHVVWLVLQLCFTHNSPPLGLASFLYRMRVTPRLAQLPLRLTLFTHDHCSLCVPVKDAMSRVWDRRHFEYREVDILDPKNSKWKSLYEFDIPVVGLIMFLVRPALVDDGHRST